MIKFIGFMLFLFACINLHKVLRNFWGQACPQYQGYLKCEADFVLVHSVANFGLEFDVLDMVASV